MSFEEKILRFKNICVVGNAPTELGKKQGKRIDSYDTVIRFNDFSLKYSEDYGSKVNIWVRAGNDAVIKTLESKNFERYDLILLRAQNEKNKESREIWQKNKQPYFSFPVSYEQVLSKELKAIPSTGLLFLYILKKCGLSLKDRVFGFSFFNSTDLKINNSHHYYYESPANSKHQWEKEKNYFNKFIMENK